MYDFIKNVGNVEKFDDGDTCSIFYVGRVPKVMSTPKYIYKFISCPRLNNLFWKIIFHGKSCIYKSKIAKFHHMKIKKIHAIPWADFENIIDSSIFAFFQKIDIFINS